MKREDATKIANETQDSYNLMAREFSDSRARFWDELSFLAQHIERDDHVLDIGCGNGRFMPLVKERHAQYTGIDYSQGLINEAKRIFPEGSFHVADATTLPFTDDSFDIAYSFAVIHHIPSAKERRKFATEALRVLHPGGKLVLTTWNLWSQKYFFKLLQSAVASLLQKNTLDVGDVMLTFGKNKRPRYVHAFTVRELRALFHEAGWSITDVDIISRKSGEANIILIAQKPF